VLTVPTPKQVRIAPTLAEIEFSHNMAPLPIHHSINYSTELYPVFAQLIFNVNCGVRRHGASFAQPFIFQKGRKKFGKRGDQAAINEFDQLHQRNCFTPIDLSKLTPIEKKKAQAAMMLLSEKKDSIVKGRCVYEGSKTRPYFTKEETASPTASAESIFITATIDAHKEHDFMTADIPNAFIQASLENLKDGDEKVVMKVTGMLVDLLVKVAPDVYGPFVVFENGRKVLYLQVLRALYGMLQAALIWYKKFRSDLESIGYVFNPHDPCIANKMIDGKQHTIRFHVDDIMASHVSSLINDKFADWFNSMYGHCGKVKQTRVHFHHYFAMHFDFSHRGQVRIHMKDYIESMLNDFPIQFTSEDSTPTPAPTDLHACSF